MRRRLILVLAAAGAVIPAALGLLGNASFAESVPTRAPAAAQVVLGEADSPAPIRTSAATPTPSTTTAADGRGGARPRTTAEPGDDHGGTSRSGSSGHGSGSAGSASSGHGSGSSGHSGGDDHSS
ncbi:MAG TPA: hypothetical protein VFJ94_16100 [Intrasporangium sp.]|uniref:hypothetical protein n=1 Tax=Intrasporangium sp. TaxID=1925024 RepID=UPI002D78E5B4|nr:hypothetical protein [Intrasporangium sp.]HET7400039.1 hypothetical protein [Intrasporangium sp.]